MLQQYQSKPDIIQLVESELLHSNLIVLVGGPSSGKSWLIKQLFCDEQI
jgi:ABC-type phosphate/phosphonate transport system ATPase subunit